jgi:molybdenum cofactor cytidylyltransferase
MIVAAVILAAGCSKRMGANKMLADIAGEPLIRRTVTTVGRSKARPLIVVTGHESEQVEGALAGLDATIIRNRRYAQGLATSLNAGIAAVPAAAAGALICLGDMPLVRPKIIDALIDRFVEEPRLRAVVPAHAGEWGNPVLLSRGLFSAIAALTGDAGARGLLRECPDVAVIEADQSVLLDADTPQALRALRLRDEAKGQAP